MIEKGREEKEETTGGAFAGRQSYCREILLLPKDGVCFESLRGKLLTKAQLWANKSYKKSHLGNKWKKPFAGSSHAKGIVLEKMMRRRRKSHDHRCIVSKAFPNASHYALAALQQRCKQEGKKFKLVTQNIDGLHMQAGSTEVVELHGSLWKARSCHCGDV
ncbi:hypothetical protein R1flu_028897 [Riccia fluitans]|uniref:Deacetylase sirtuin-type domain-containing protein n=1 Tax=Riccia fluitans TaxID=41844 RepID=A0ABD1XN09_9MARC